MIQMGARPYNPTLGRFLEVDPIEGGSCNDYDYTCAEPINQLDLDGRACLDAKGAVFGKGAVHGPCRNRPCGTGRSLRNTLTSRYSYVVGRGLTLQYSMGPVKCLPGFMHPGYTPLGESFQQDFGRACPKARFFSPVSVADDVSALFGGDPAKGILNFATSQAASETIKRSLGKTAGQLVAIAAVPLDVACRLSSP